MRFLIIGGDAAGMSAASRARRNDPGLDITVLERSSDVSYSACGMPYNIADAGRSMDDLVVRPARVFREKQDINLLTGHAAETIDPAARTVSGRGPGGEGFSLEYDKLLIATGASARLPDVPGIGTPGLMSLKNLADGRAIKEYIKDKKVGRVLIIGMGYVGLEMAEALRAREIEVTMLKPREAFLPWLAESLVAVVRQEVESRGVKLLPGCALRRVEGGGDALEAVCDDFTLTRDMIIVATGVVPNSDITSGTGIELGSRREIAVNRRMETSLDDIYAAGDCADAYHLVTGRKTWVPLALRANRSGRAVGDNVCGRGVELPGIAGTSVFKVFDLEVARTGLTVSEAEQAGFEPARVEIKSRSRAHAHPGAEDIHLSMVGDKSSGRLLGVQMVGREGVAHRVNAPAVALGARMTVADFAQSDLAYSPPFGPVWDPLLTGAGQLLKQL
ncbi:MAG: FAD-dependent oxidoreductase [Desulfosudaceae bacterium]